MGPPRSLSRTAIEQLVRAVDAEAKVVEIASMAGGLSSSMTKVTLEGAQGTDALVVRMARVDSTDQRPMSIADEYRLIESLRGLDAPAPRPRHLARAEDDVLASDAAVYDFVEGAPRVAVDDPVQVGTRFAETLVRIHDTDTGRLPTLPDRTAKITAALAEPPGPTDDSSDEARIRACLQRAWPPSPPIRTRLLHGDYFPGNVLWRGDAIVAVIDWEHAAIGDPLIDVATTRLDLAWAYGPRATEAFTRTYLETTGTDPTALPVWDLVAALRPCGAISSWAADWNSLGRPDITPEWMRGVHRAFVQDALEAISRASPRSP